MLKRNLMKTSILFMIFIVFTLIVKNVDVRPIGPEYSKVGLGQLISRKSLFRVDIDIILLGVYYVLVAGLYIFFEICVVNYRPIILGEGLESSFPSSHTMIVLCIMATAMIQFKKRISKRIVRKIVQIISIVIMVVTVLGRLISGVHWFTDIVAGLLLGGALILFYHSMHQVVASKG